ncbi:uracil phosphoribosyltransferase [Sulfurihydrogenibium azorense]|uniref:uracil phosphoribosyltransferase n=1 Tax=Sulfurihydrogenibium azorense TaxID=309806 RepID=UPI00240A51A1|nr:uracil phosphoribosyltransferase [Sulfurihydrogenibium azorense]MDM7272981.1 uracil phosphoribosyltransferase [Sulfurihydrogenibium azorense]
MERVFVVDNSILQNSLTKIRDKDLKPSLVRKHLSIIGKVLLIEALKNEDIKLKRVETWFTMDNFPVINEDDYVIVPILRAGLPMMEGCLEVLEDAKVGFLAIKRNEETLESKVFYERLPELENKTVIITDPMVATGGSLIKAIEIIKSKNPKKIISLNVIASKEGLERVSKFKDVFFT